MLGPYPLPVFGNDPVTKIVDEKILEESGNQWTNLEFWCRGVGPMRADCEPKVLIGMEEPEGEAW
jgi:hypothetical protein